MVVLRYQRILYYSGLAAILAWALFVYRRFYSVDPSRQMLVYLLLGGGLAVSWISIRVEPGIKSTLAALWLTLTLGVIATIAFMHPLAALGMVAMAGTWYVMGANLVQWLGVAAKPRLTKTIHAMSVGMALYSLVVLGLGAARLLHAFVLWGLMGVVLAWGARKFQPACIRTSIVDGHRRLMQMGMLGWLMLLLGSVYFGIFLVKNLAPPLLGDDLTYHLAVARIFARDSAVHFLPYFTHFNSPFGAEMLYTAGMVLGSEYALTGLINLGYAVALLGAFILLGRRLGGSGIGGVTAWLIFFSVPYYTILTYSGSADLKFLLYVLLAIDAFLWWCETNSIRTLVLCAAEVGFSFHYRYHGLILFAALFLSVAWKLRLPETRRRDWRSLLYFVGIAALVGCPWLLRNWINTGNPIFPTSTHFFHGYFGDLEMSEIWREYGNPASPWLFGAYGLGMGWLNYLTLPWRVTFLGGVFEGYELTPVFLVLAPFGLWFMARNRPARNLSLFAGFYATAWFFQMHQLKFLIPAFAVCALVAAAGALAWAEQLGRWGRGAIVALVLAPTICALKIPLVYSREQLQDAISIALHPRGKGEFLTKHFGVYPMIESMNRELPKDALVFSVDEQNLFYLDRSYILGGPHHQIFVDYRTMVTFRDLLARLRELRVTHLLMRLGPPAPDHLIGAPHAALALLVRAVDFSQLHEIKRHQELVLYKINYDPDLGPYNPTKHADYVELGDVLMEYGMLERARVQYAKAGQAGASKCAAIQQMDSLARGRFYLSKARELRRTFFLGPALKEFTAARASGVVAEAEQGAQGVAEVYQAGMQFAPHIWARLPSGDWFFRQKTF